jgi:hypothetical protein
MTLVQKLFQFLKTKAFQYPSIVCTQLKLPSNLDPIQEDIYIFLVIKADKPL